MKAVAVIPARGGSVRVPKKNIQLVGGFLLVEHALHHYAECTLVDAVVISVDDPETVLTVLRLDDIWIDSFHARGCPGDGPMVDVLLDACNSAVLEGERYDAVVCLQPTSPFRTGADIDACVELLRKSPHADSVVSVDETTGKRNGAVYVTRLGMLRDGLVFDDNSLTYPMPRERSIDINTPEDLELARKMWKEQCDDRCVGHRAPYSAA